VTWQKKATTQAGNWSKIKDAATIASTGVQLPLSDVLIQNGHDCKVVALANLDNYYASALEIPNIPVHKNHQGFFVDERNRHTEAASPHVSLRQIAKKQGSLQGEVLESGILRGIAKEIGYASKKLEPQNLAQFKLHVTQQLSKGRPLIACFAVSRGNADGAPQGFPSLRYNDNEHACVISAIDTSKETLTINHWGNKFVVPLRDFYHSMNLLPATRETETYGRTSQEPLFNGKTRSEVYRNSTAVRLMGSYMKYDLVSPNSVSEEQFESSRTSGSPKKKSGFKNRLYVMTPDKSNPRWGAVALASVQAKDHE
jgi:hypothetical protein